MQVVLQRFLILYQRLMEVSSFDEKLSADVMSLALAMQIVALSCFSFPTLQPLLGFIQAVLAQ